jgi:hypothetical protein
MECFYPPKSGEWGAKRGRVHFRDGASTVRPFLRAFPSDGLSQSDIVRFRKIPNCLALGNSEDEHFFDVEVPRRP